MPSHHSRIISPSVQLHPAFEINTCYFSGYIQGISALPNSKSDSMDPFSITAGALGITGFAISSIVQLHDLIDSLAEAKTVVQDVASNLEGIQRPLAALDELKISNRAIADGVKDDLIKTGIAETVNNCGRACDDFTKNLEKWTKHSSTAKISLRDRLSVGIWNKERIRTFRTQVQSCQATVQLSVTSAQL